MGAKLACTACRAPAGPTACRERRPLRRPVVVRARRLVTDRTDTTDARAGPGGARAGTARADAGPRSDTNARSDTGSRPGPGAAGAHTGANADAGSGTTHSRARSDTTAGAWADATNTRPDASTAGTLTAASTRGSGHAH